jgi:hypothetical protein
MSIVTTALYAIIIVVIFAFVAVISYIIFDYMEYKKQAKVNLEKTVADINYNFDVSTSNISKLYDLNNDTKKTNSRILELDLFTSNTSNLLSKRITDTSTGIDNNLNNFHNNLNRYFTFNDGVNNITSVSAPNNKIFNYVFGSSIPNMDLITKTTAISGLTIKSSADKELTVCSANDQNKCIKMDADANGNFTLTPAGTNNIVFKNNDKTSTIANFDTQNKSVFLGGINETTSAMYIKNNEVYVKSLKLIAPDLENSRILNHSSYYKEPIYTLCSIDFNNGTTGGRYNTTIEINITFENSYKLNEYNYLYIYIPYVKVDVLNTISWNKYDNETPLSFPYVLTTLKNEAREVMINKVTYENSMVFKFNNIDAIKSNYTFSIIFRLSNDINITTLEQFTNSLKLVTKSYLKTA